MIFIDANIPIYAWGREHPLKGPAIEILSEVALSRQAFVTDAEVMQELLHRYHSLRIWQLAREPFQGFLELMAGRTAPLLVQDVQEAGRIVAAMPHLSARDAVHLGVMRRLRVTRITTADKGFDGIPGLERLDPGDFAQWRDSIGP